MENSKSISTELTALIVDDEEDIGLMTKLMLNSKGITADYAGRIEVAKKRISQNQYELFILDLHLPDGSGFDLIPKIKKLHSNADIIIISAYDGASEKSKAVEYGVADFIKKPFKKQDLFKAVDNITNK
jgi:DNA-binding response OmpR family regulator